MPILLDDVALDNVGIKAYAAVGLPLITNEESASENPVELAVTVARPEAIASATIDASVAPSGTITVAGTPTIDGALLAKFTTTPPTGAGNGNDTTRFSGCPCS